MAKVIAAAPAVARDQCYLCRRQCVAVELGGLGYWKCSVCGFIRRRELGVDVGETYGEEYYSSDHTTYPDWDNDLQLRAILQSRVATLALLRPARGRLLDIGCGLGHFLTAAQADGWAVCGTEPSAYAASAARARGAAVYPDLDAIAAANEAPFDCVTLWDVLEHDSDPLELLGRAGSLMRSGSLLAVSMPNLGGLEARLRSRSWRFFRPEYGHVTHHNVGTLQHMLGLAGFEVIGMQTHGSVNIAARLPVTQPLAQAAQRVLDRVAELGGLGRTMTAFAVWRPSMTETNARERDAPAP